MDRGSSTPCATARVPPRDRPTASDAGAGDLQSPAPHEPQISQMPADRILPSARICVICGFVGVTAPRAAKTRRGVLEVHVGAGVTRRLTCAAHRTGAVLPLWGGKLRQFA